MSRRALIALVGLGAALIVAVPLAWASHQFTDVPNTNPFHADIAAVKDAGITSGKTCVPPGTPPTFCPSEGITREAMAAFVHRGFGRVGASGSTADITLTTSFQDIAQDSITAGGVSGGSGFVLLLGSFTLHGDVGTLPESSRIEFRFVQDGTAFLSNVSEVSIDPSSTSNPSAAPAKQWVFSQPTGTTETYSLQARVASVGGGTIVARSRLITLVYLPFGSSGTSSLGTQGAPVGPAPNSDGTDG